MSSPFQDFTVNDLPIHVLPTTKYKTTFLSLYIRQPLNEETYTKTALIPYILKRGTAQHPTSQHIRQALDDLYGASFEVSVSKRGEEQLVVFRMQLANEQFLQAKEPLLEKGLQLFHEIITNPLTNNGVFDSAIVEREKELLKRKLEQVKDDKIRYANKRCVEEMFANERFRLHAHGSVDQMDDLSAENLYAYYEQMIHRHPAHLFIVGDVDVEQVPNQIRNFEMKREQLLDIPPTTLGSAPEKERTVRETTTISQGKLHIGCRTNTTYADDVYIPFIVTNGLFGGFSHSKLFRNVREKHSLAYYVSSSIESHKGFMMIASGVDPAHYEQAVSIIKEQLRDIQNGNITEEELSQTKAMLTHHMKESNDLPYMLMERKMNGIIAGKERSAEQVLETVTNVTGQHIQQVAQRIEIDTIYFLTSDDEGAK